MKDKRNPIPEFKTEEQEADYWDTHSPLDFDTEPEVEKVRIKNIKDKPITIRLDSENRRKLDKLAAEQGLGSSTFARQVLLAVIEPPKKIARVITPDEIADIFQRVPQYVRDRVEPAAGYRAAGTPDNHPYLLIDATQQEDLEQFTRAFLRALLAKVGVQVITPEDSEYEKLKTSALKKGKG